MDYKEIKHLLDLYLEGNTNLSEEENLRLFFKSTKELPPEWEPFRSFLDIMTKPSWNVTPKK